MGSVRLSPLEQAQFELWLEHCATDEKRLLEYDKQVECHVLWLLGESAESFALENIRTEDMDGPH